MKPTSTFLTVIAAVAISHSAFAAPESAPAPVARPAAEIHGINPADMDPSI